MYIYDQFVMHKTHLFCGLVGRRKVGQLVHHYVTEQHLRS